MDDECSFKRHEVGCQWWVTLRMRLAVALLEFTFDNEASCSALSVCQTDPALVGSMNMYCESYDIFMVQYTRLAN